MSVKPLYGFVSRNKHIIEKLFFLVGGFISV
jgi:hypothetical protein